MDQKGKNKCDECGATLLEDHSCPNCHGVIG